MRELETLELKKRLRRIRRNERTRLVLDFLLILSFFGGIVLASLYARVISEALEMVFKNR